MSESRPDAVDPDAVDPDAVDPDAVDPGGHELQTLAAVAAGGVLGAEARYGLATALPHGGAAWPWATLLTNVLGSALIGVLMVVVERRSPHRLVRPVLGVGVLGGFTTFSTFTLDTRHLLDAGRPFVALGYVAVSLIGCVTATGSALAATRRAVTA